MSNATISATSMRIMRLLIGKPPRTLASLVEEAGVTRTAVSEQLATLMQEGFVQRTVARAGRGRPHHLYSTTEAANSLFPSKVSGFMPAVFRAVEQVCGPDARRQMVDSVTKDLVDQYEPRLTAATPSARLAQFAELLRGEGQLVDVLNDGACLVLQERTCPYAPLSQGSRFVCEIEERMISSLVGATVRLTDCRLDGCPACAFRVDPDLAASSPCVTQLSLPEPALTANY